MSLSTGNDVAISSDLPLLPEVWYRICSFLPKTSLFNLRLVCSKLGSIAQPECFKTIYIEVYRECASERLSEIAKSPKLRNYVREMVLDSSFSPDSEFSMLESWESRQHFLVALPYLRFFRMLTSLRIRFQSTCSGEFPAPHSGFRQGYRYAVLDTIFHCVAGMWTGESQVNIENKTGFRSDGNSYWGPDRDRFDSGTDNLHQQAIPLRQLIVANIANYHDPKLNASEAFKKVISMPSLVDLRLHVIDGFSSPFSREKYEFYDGLRVSWLTPDITDNLRVLALNCKEFWGWCPNMDFRRFGSSPFPQLKALSLGRYVFSHKWQIDWFTSIGQGNGSGGLEELYLLDCPILHEATQIGPFDTFDLGYPVTNTVLSQAAMHETHKYPIRWHSILSRWAKVLNKLKVFYMGRSTYEDRLRESFTRKSTDFEQNALRYRLWHDRQEELMSPCPTAADVHGSIEKAFGSKAELISAEFNQHRDFQMQYIKYNINREPYNRNWPWGDPKRGQDEVWAPEEETVMRDDAAYEMLMDAVYARASLGDGV